MNTYTKHMRILTITIFLLFQVHVSFGQTSLKKIGLDHGDYSVGFHHYLTTDSTRTYTRIYDWSTKSMLRPIPVSLWYPSDKKSNTAKPFKIQEYMDILKEEEEWEYLPNDQILNWFYYANTPSNQDHLTETTTAFPDIAPASGKFPVVIYAPSYQAASIENFALCEYLASHGYIVIASPSRGAENRFFEGGTGKDLETQARDIEFLSKEVLKRSNADPDRIATMGFSFGGLSNVLAQMRNHTFKAIVSLDGSIKYQYPTLKKSPFFDIEKVDVPFIHMSQKDIPEQVLKEDKIDPSLNHDFEFYDSLTNSKAYQLRFQHLTHSHFSTLGVLFEQRDARQDKSDAEIMASYRLVSRYTLHFLDAFLKNDAEGLAFMENSPTDNGIKNGLLTYTSKAPKKQAFTFQNFNDLAANQQYKHLRELYDTTLKKHPEMELPEGNLNNLGLQLIFNRKTSEQGIQVFLLATHIYPNSANLFDSLAEGYLYMNNTEKAIASFEKSLALNSENQNAIDRLKELRE